MLLVSKIVEYDFEYKRYFQNVRKIQKYQIFDYTTNLNTRKARKVNNIRLL